MTKLLTAAVAFSLIMLTPAIQAGTVTVGLPVDAKTGNCIPFGCAAGVIGTFTEYQEIYASSAFPSGGLITGISFFNTQEPAGSIDSATYTFWLSTTSVSVGGLSSTLSSNIGPDNTQFFSGVLSGPITGGVFTVIGTPFDYNPANGNLLLDILISNPTSIGGSSVFLDESGASPATTQRAYIDGGVSSAGSGGLVTQFTLAPVSISVPEPSTWGLGSISLLLLTIAGRRRPSKS